ncbi:uncharacterized protein ZK673.1-like [Tubulanus polymorphus]|uniref:uncharacterized protein ZK673.1-like n=1 Tax=Tubulanus polymorphus TaxID=672921 RepID=UPI003DA52C30
MNSSLATVCCLLITFVCVSSQDDLSAQLKSSCADQSSNCRYLSDMCQQAQYKAIMAIKCKETCGYCNGMGSGDCMDSSEKCPYVKDKVCPNRFLAIKYCKFTCGLCL